MYTCSTEGPLEFLRYLILSDGTAQQNPSIRCRNHENDFNISVDSGNALQRRFIAKKDPPLKPQAQP